MKKSARRIFAFIFALTLLASPALAAAGGTGAAVYSNTTYLAEGFSYTNEISYNPAGSRVETFSLALSPDSSVYPIVMACDTIYGGMTIDTVTEYANGLGYNVVGAINADFGFWETRIPCGMVVENGIYKSSPEDCSALAFTDGAAFVSIMPSIKIRLEAGGKSFEITHFNKTRTDTGGLYLYSEHFSTVSTRTSGNGWAVRMKILDGKMTVSGTMSLQVESVYTGKDPQYIGEGYMVLTAGDGSNLSEIFESFAVGDKLTLTTTCSDERLSSAKWITGCGDVLVHNGSLYLPEYWNKEVAGYNPRTCAGIMPDGTVIFRVIDGRSSASAGATLSQVANDFIEMGCVDAVNFDGGGSSALSAIMPGENASNVQNVPSDGYQRRVASFILFVTDAKPDGNASRLFLGEDGAFVLAGSSLPISFEATDDSLRPASVPSDASARSGGLGAVSKGVYTAGQNAGVDTLTLSSSKAGISGTASIHIITKADTLSVTGQDGEPVEKIAIDEGAEFKINVSASYLRRPVYMDPGAVVYEITGDIGEVSEDGLFTASDIWGAAGTIKVSAAGLTKTINVHIGAVFDDIKTHWARGSIEKLYGLNIVNGITETSFGPDIGMKRGDFLLMLYRAAGKPEVTAMSGFTDVPDSFYYAKAIAWAKEAGIAQGTGAGVFEPEATLTREQAFTFISRAFSSLGLTAPAEDALANSNVLSGFPDAASLSEWAVLPAKQLIYLKIVNGMDDGRLDPQGTLTRSQMATILSGALKLGK
ncbi:MAG: S-layer homology domain-containing protein [Oscillospiraceae bacterium]|jgi:hypothetical protein